MITSPNLGNVIGRLSRAKAAMPAKIREAIAPEEHISDLRVVAFEAMHAIAKYQTEIEAIPIIMESLSSGQSGNASEFSMHAFPFSSLNKAFDPTELATNQDLRQRILDWVERYKIKDQRDTLESGEPLDNARIASRVVGAIRADPEPWLSVDSPGKGALNPEGLAMITGLTGLTSQQASRLLLAVIAAWVIYMKQNLPAIAAVKIREAFAE